MKNYKRGQIYYADLSPVIGSEQGGTRPVLVIQNDMGNRYSTTLIVGCITTRTTKSKIPTHLWLDESCGLPKDSMVMLEQIRTIDKKRIKNYVGSISESDMKKVDKAIKISLGVS